MNKREKTIKEMISGIVGFLVISCIYGGYLYKYKDISVGEIIREIAVFTVTVVGISFIGLFIFFLLALVWAKIKKERMK